MKQAIVISAEGEDHGRADDKQKVNDSTAGTGSVLSKKMGTNERAMVMARCPVANIPPDRVHEMRGESASRRQTGQERGDIVFKEPIPDRTIQLEVKCLDGEASSQMLEDVLISLDCEPASMDSRRVPLVGMGRTMFTANCTVQVPEDFSSAAIARNIELMIPGARASIA